MRKRFEEIIPEIRAERSEAVRSIADELQFEHDFGASSQRETKPPTDFSVAREIHPEAARRAHRRRKSKGKKKNAGADAGGKKVTLWLGDL